MGQWDQRRVSLVILEEAGEFLWFDGLGLSVEKEKVQTQAKIRVSI